MKKNLGLALTILVISLWINLSPAHAVCFDFETGSRMVVELELSQIEKEKCTLVEESKNELMGQIDSLTTIVEKREQELELKDKQMDEYKGLIKEQNQLCKEAIKEAKPSIMDGFLKILAGVAIGIGIALTL